ncbi:hypothetical protein EDD37DRAFT_584745 [Exophiala viscosa]|uniref:uncharacterized protein n=1 Tax=Exophiala viscosa TaxID=2486360 RepID=UPI00218F3B1B|nr:hypothetical protein EDD37DRAFT_584745 [Exophiala viscosa]
MTHSHRSKNFHKKNVADDDFPPSSWLGYGIDLTAVGPNDINAVTEAIITTYALIPMSPTTSVVDVANAKWNKPDNVNVAVDVASSSSSLNSWKDGTSTAEALKTNASLSAQYMAVSGDVSISYCVNSSFEEDRSYSLFSYNQNVADVKFKSYGQSIDKDTLATAISGLNLQNWDPANKDVVNSYKTLFNVLGSHIVVGATYGGRFQMVHLSVAYNGLVTSGKIDASVQSEDQYKSYSKEVMQQVSCQGGDVSLSAKLNTSYRADDIYSTFQQWAQSSTLNPGVMNLETTPLWTVMAATFDPDILKHSNDVKSAFYWILENPAPHWTKGVVTINSDWGEFGITSPSAYIIQDPDLPPTVDNLVFSGTKIQWGREYSHAFQRDVTINFIIVNDGSGLNFELSHGSDGASSKDGRIDVTFNNNTYTASAVTDNNWNTQFFFNKPVNPNEHTLTQETVSTGGFSGTSWDKKFIYDTTDRQRPQGLTGQGPHKKHKAHHAK